MDFIDPKIDQYAGDHTSAESDVLADLNRETWAKVLMPRMLSGHIQGRTLAMFSQMRSPRYILEIGTYTGYSALCMAEGLQDGGELHTLDINEELEDMVRTYIDRAGMKDRVIPHIGNALDIIPTLPHKWDMVFIDADKENYSNYFDLVIDRMAPGGILIADNVLWSGKVLDDPSGSDEETRALQEFNEKVHKDDRVENVLLPIRDGLMVIRVR